MNKLAIIAAALALAVLPMAGCLQNANDLKDRLSQNFVADEKVNSGVVPTPSTGAPLGKSNTTADNVTQPKRELKPPVARMEIYGVNGALVYQADFVASDYTEGATIGLGALTLIATPSEAISPGADLVKYEWDVNGQKIEGRKANVEITSYGMHMVKLTVTDSDGLKDSQMVHLVAPPQPFTETLTLTGGPLVGASGAPTAAQEHAFKVLASVDDKPVKALKMVVTVATDATHDASLTVTGPDKTSATANDGNPSTTGGETLTIDNPATGDWLARADTNAGVTQAHTITIEITYIEVVDGIGDGHGGHAH